MGIRVVRVYFYRLPQFVDSIFHIAFLRVSYAKIIMGFTIIRFHLNRMFVLINGFIDLIYKIICNSQVVIRFCVCGIQLDSHLPFGMALSMSPKWRYMRPKL